MKSRFAGHFAILQRVKGISGKFETPLQKWSAVLLKWVGTWYGKAIFGSRSAGDFENRLLHAERHGRRPQTGRDDFCGASFFPLRHYSCIHDAGSRRAGLLVRFLLDEQKKMNNYHRAPTLQVPVVTVLFLKAVPPLRIYLSTSISLGGLRRSFARSPVEKSLPPRHEDTKCFILNEYLSAFVAESFYNGGFRPHL